MSRFLAISILMLVGCSSTFAQITLVARTAATSTSPTTTTTTGLNLTSCTPAAHCMIAACWTGNFNALPAAPVSDSQGNTWVLVSNGSTTASQIGPPNSFYTSGVQMWVTFPTSTGGTTQTFTAGSTAFGQAYPSIAIAAFNGVASGADKIASAIISTNNQASGSITPTNDGELVFGCHGDATTAGSNVGVLTQLDALNYVANDTNAVVDGYQIQTTAAAVNPTWGGTANCCYGGATVASFYSTQHPAPLTVATASLPEGFNSVAYNATVIASGGVSPYTWTQTGGTLPTGLSFSGGVISGTPTQTIANDAETFHVVDSLSSAASSSGLTLTIAASILSITTTTCPGGTQYQTYAGCTIVAAGGTSPYTYSWNPNSTVLNFNALPEGMTLNSSTGAITSALIAGQGTYGIQVNVTDALGATATTSMTYLTFAITGSNSFLSNIFPATSIFHHRMDSASTSLPVDTSPAAPIYSAYLPAALHPLFGATVYDGGIPALQVPCTQATLSVTTSVYQSYFTSGPIPSYAPVEGTSNSPGDKHVLVYRQAGCSLPPSLWELWEGVFSAGAWTDGSNALWSDVTTNALTPMGMGTSDAAGLPVAPLLLNADEVIGGGTPSVPTGTVQHPTRFTLAHMLPYWVWPGTQASGVGNCSDNVGFINGNTQISQSAPPVSCPGQTAPAGEIYRLKAATVTPSCASTSPQSAIIITALRNYGIILADNGLSGGLSGTPDARWSDTDLACLTNIHLSDFEPVNVSSLIISNSSGATLSGSTVVSRISRGATISHGAIIQ